jgi:general stress protein 26
MDYLDIIEHFDKCLKSENTINKKTAILSTMPQSPENFPASRMIVLREFDVKNMRLTVFTHALSEKVEEISKNPNSTLVWYDSEEGLQIQFYCFGKIEVETPKVDEIIKELKVHAYKDYFGPKPGSLLQKEQIEILKNPQKISREEIKFCLLHFDIQEIVTLKLGQSHHEKRRYKNLTDNFTQEDLLP